MTLGFAACSSQDLPQPVQVQDDHDGSYVQLQFSFADVTSRAGEDDATDAAAYTETESSGKYRQGEVYEYAIKKVYLCFFKEVTDDSGATTVTPVQIGGNSLHEISVYKKATDSSTSEADNTTADDGSANSAGKAVTWTTVPIALPSGLSATDEEGNQNTYRVYALINRAPENLTITSEQDLLDSKMDFLVDAEVDEIERSSEGNVTTITIPMAARSYDGTVYQILKPTKANTKNNPYVLNFEVERSYARIAFLGESHTVNAYASYDSDNKPVGSPVASIQLEAYQVINQERSLYTYRHVGNISDKFAVTYGGYAQATTTNPFVIDPNSGSKTTGEIYKDLWQPLDSAIRVSDINDLGKTKFKLLQAADGETPTSVEYVPENTMYTTAQRKGQSTGIIFAAKIIPQTLDGKDNSKEGYSASKDLFYYEGQFFTSLAKLKEITNIPDPDYITPSNISNYGIRYFRHGLAYFEYYIRHVNNNDYTTMGQMEFGIVRNNSYELQVLTVAMSGAYSKLPGDDPDDPKDPNTPIDETTPDPNDDDESSKVYMQVNIKVRPWVVRTNKMILGL
jgi:hypothetical protein